MEKLLDIDEIRNELHSPIAICDGGEIGTREQYLIHLFENEKIDFVLEEGLYKRPNVDILKTYQTIAFSTQDSGPYASAELQRLFSFDMSNLKTLILLNRNAFRKIGEMAKKMPIKCLGFEAESFQFFDPFEREVSGW